MCFYAHAHIFLLFTSAWNIFQIRQMLTSICVSFYWVFLFLFPFLFFSFYFFCLIFPLNPFFFTYLTCKLPTIWSSGILSKAKSHVVDDKHMTTSKTSKYFDKIFFFFFLVFHFFFLYWQSKPNYFFISNCNTSLTEHISVQIHLLSGSKQ